MKNKMDEVDKAAKVLAEIETEEEKIAKAENESKAAQEKEAAAVAEKAKNAYFESLKP